MSRAEQTNQLCVVHSLFTIDFVVVVYNRTCVALMILPKTVFTLSAPVLDRVNKVSNS